MAEIMTPDHPCWDEFADILADKDHLDIPDEPGPMKCDHTHKHARAILAAMGDFDIEETIHLFEEFGGYCDCEILLNVDPGPPEDED